ncbi:hypothetical protein [Candidatus Methylomicrobium oryzae]|uniref:hypothetical protein n=1 Tax=Candidatus Methylomicrobium oryzae TaxID=2802053 RepID=UPI0019212C69|nr:hypothetical protein [Methylomicrobium sp. RS1]MBL1265042.1 hypothetical protein [Methylomicrobium sp. RS1]
MASHVELLDQALRLHRNLCLLHHAYLEKPMDTSTETQRIHQLCQKAYRRVSRRYDAVAHH